MAYQKQYDWQDIYVVRPANVYGRYDNFDTNNAMVIPSLIARAINVENPLKILGNGMAIRDFIHASDVADGMILVMKKKFNKPINLGSGEERNIKDVANALLKSIPSLTVKWVKSSFTGDRKRLMSVKKAKHIGFKTKINLEDGIMDTIELFKENSNGHKKKYNSFLEKN